MQRRSDGNPALSDIGKPGAGLKPLGSPRESDRSIACARSFSTRRSCGRPPWAVAPVESEVEVDVRLVLGVDVSRSMTPRELDIKRRGDAEAIVSEDVLNADGALQQVAIAYVEWAGAQSQQVVVDWTLVRDRADAEAFAAQLTARFERTLHRTLISGVPGFAGLAEAPMSCTSWFNWPRSSPRTRTRKRPATVRCCRGHVTEALP